MRTFEEELISDVWYLYPNHTPAQQQSCTLFESIMVVVQHRPIEERVFGLTSNRSWVEVHPVSVGVHVHEVHTSLLCDVHQQLVLFGIVWAQFNLEDTMR